ncbi:MAG: glycosyltransferase family 4 protein [Algisphaera sp.]
MKILHAVEFYEPSVGGAQAVVREVSERLVARGHQVTVATTALPERTTFEHNGVNIVGFNVSGNFANGICGSIDTYQRFLADGDFDVMMAYAAQQWTVDAAWGLFDRLPYATVLAPCGFSGLHDPRYANYFARLPRLMRRFNRLIFHSDTYQDRTFADSHGLQDISTIIPNAADGAGFPKPDPEADAIHAAAFRQRHGIPADGPLLLTVGTHTGMKGHACTLAAFRQLDASPAHLLIIGNGTPNTGCWNACHRGVKRATRGRKTARTLDLPRPEVLAAFRAADLFLFPSRIECSPLVLFECLAAGLPFVASPAGNSTEIAAWSDGGLMVHATGPAPLQIKPKHLAQATDALLADPKRRMTMAAAGRAAFEARFDWEHAIDAYEAVYRDAIAHHRDRQGP